MTGTYISEMPATTLSVMPACRTGIQDDPGPEYRPNSRAANNEW